MAPAQNPSAQIRTGFNADPDRDASVSALHPSGLAMPRIPDPDCRRCQYRLPGRPRPRKDNAGSSVSSDPSRPRCSGGRGGGNWVCVCVCGGGGGCQRLHLETPDQINLTPHPHRRYACMQPVCHHAENRHSARTVLEISLRWKDGLS